jgi:hypothetical protein
MANRGNQSGHRRAWKKTEVAELDRLIRQGKPAHVIARRLKRPTWAIYNRHDLAKRRKGVVFGLQEIARLFGVDKNIPAIWQKHGWLPRTHNGAYAAQQVDEQRQAYDAFSRELEPGFVSLRETRDPVKPGRMAAYLITDTAIEAFMTNRATWYAWHVADITDPAWRALAETLRAQTTDRWLTTQEFADRIGCVVDTARMWHQRGFTEGIETARYGIHLYWWSGDLKGWVPPVDWQRLGVSSRTALKLARDGVTSSDLARELVVPLAVASRLLALLMERGLLRREADPARSSGTARPGRYIYWRA